MDGRRETNIMWERHNDCDTEIMKKREGVVHEIEMGRRHREKENKDTRKIDSTFLSSLLPSSPLLSTFFIASIESLQSIVLHSVT